jgi:uncharacterized membrane protein YkvA (DUF1232 family)
MKIGQWVKAQAQRLKTETIALYWVARHPATPWYAKVLVFLVVAYAVSPIDLIPDFIPVLGLLDDLLLLPLGIALALKLVPPAVMQECRARAAENRSGSEAAGRVGAALVVSAWLLIAAIAGIWLLGA